MNYNKKKINFDFGPSFSSSNSTFFVAVTFWILALDHDLRLVRGELAYVALVDPAGTKVAIWEELSMDEGKHKYRSCCRVTSYMVTSLMGKS